MIPMPERTSHSFRVEGHHHCHRGDELAETFKLQLGVMAKMTGDAHRQR